MPQKIRMPSRMRPISKESVIAEFIVLRRMTEMKILRATMPTNPAAIHSIVSIKRSIDARFMSAPDGFGLQGESGGRRIPPPCQCEVRVLLRQGVVLAERAAKFCHRRVRVGAGLLDTFGPGLDQRLGGFLSQRRLLPLLGLGIAL